MATSFNGYDKDPATNGVNNVAIAQAQLAYELFIRRFSGERWSALQARGAKVQRPLWASTSTKNPDYPDTLYVDRLIGPNTVNTLPDQTLEAFDDHGSLARTIDVDIESAHRIWAELKERGVDAFAEFQVPQAALALRQGFGRLIRSKKDLGIVAVLDKRLRTKGYGKGIIVGSAGEIEHGAMWHIPGGAGMRAALGKGTSIVPSTKKVAGVGARLDVPITHLEWSYVGSHYDAIEVGVPDGPRPDEMVVILAMAIGGRVHARLAGGFTLADRGKPGVPA